MTAPTGPTAPPTTYTDSADPGVTGRLPQQAPTPAPARRSISMRIAAIIGVLAFLVGAGVAMLVGPIMGGPGGPGGPGGVGGPPGTSTSQTQTGTGQTGT